MIEINNVTKKFNDFVAVDSIDLKIDDASFVALLGPNGAGKTTLIKMLTTLLRPTEGEIYIDGEKVGRNNNRVKRKIGVVPQHINLEKELTTYENLVFAAKLFKMKKSQYRSRIEELIEFMELEEYRDRLSQQLSGGIQRRVMIAKALVNKPSIIFLDEPTVGIDINARRRIWDALKFMNKAGITILLTTHYIEEAETLCDRVCFMDKGKIFKDDSPENLKEALGRYTVEYFTKESMTCYRYFDTREEAMDFADKLENNDFTIRELTLEDVFYNYSNRKVI
ncbi:ABC transporter ATP-binding protein [Tissierellaceae bacterium HCP3S3_D8]